MVVPAADAAVIRDVLAPDLLVSREPRPTDGSGELIGPLLIVHPSSLRRRRHAQPVQMPRRRTYSEWMDQPDESYRICAECGQDCEPDTSVGADGFGVRITWVCPEHGVHSVVDPFEDLR